MTAAVIITGCSGGIGSAMVEECSRQGYYTVGIDRVEPEAMPDHLILTDLRRISIQESCLVELQNEIDSSLSTMSLAAVINNAAVQNIAAFGEFSIDQIRETFDVNVIVPFLLGQLCFDSLKSCGGSIVNIGSIHSRLTKPGFTAYATSKGALESLTRALAVEIGDSVRVNAIMPAAIETAMLLEGFGEDSVGFESLKSHHPVKRIGTPEQVATLAVAMIRMELPFLNGSIVDLSGGISSRLHDPC